MKLQPRATKFTRRGGPAVDHLVLVRSMRSTFMLVTLLLTGCVEPRPAVSRPVRSQTVDGRHSADSESRLGSFECRAPHPHAGGSTPQQSLCSDRARS